MSGIETPEAPAWLSKLESQREKLSKAKLGHDSGAGAPCNDCGSKCPGLDLHFWRKICRACLCHKDVHDVQDDAYGWAQFELLGKAQPKKTRPVFVKINGIANEPVKLDWVPPNVSPDMVSDYMSCLGEELAPVAGSEGAAKRREQLRRQIPPHDIRSDLCCHTLSKQEKDCHQEYISRIKSHVVGMGNIVRIGAIKKGDLLTINTEGSQPVSGTKSYSLPLKLSNLSNGIKYLNVPKNTTDKVLVLDNMGNVISKSGHLTDYKASPILSKIVKAKLTSMKIESDRIKSAVEHGPVYDSLFKDLKKLNSPIDADVYLSPIQYFRQEYNCNPKFKEETTAFAESQGSKLMTLSPKNIDNNDNVSSDQMPLAIAYPKKGTIYAPNGEIWSWSASADPASNNSLNSNYVNPAYGHTYEDVMHSGDLSDIPPPTYESIRNPNQYDDSMNSEDDIPPPLNYNTHPSNMSLRDGVAGLNIHAIPGDLRNVKIGDKNRYPGDNKNNESKQAFNRSINTITENVGNMGINTPDNEYDADKPIICQRCNRPIQYGEIAVKAERAGDNVSWHPQCFTCIKCNQLLADLVYFYHKNEIYCARDLAEALKVLRCSACDELIFTSRHTIAEGKTYHTNHFCCLRCDSPLGGKKYVPDDKSGQPICLECYDNFYADKCHACNNTIAPDEQGVSWKTFHWHGTCFKCVGIDCGKSLLDAKFKVVNDMPFCSAVCIKKTVV